MSAVELLGYFAVAIGAFGTIGVVVLIVWINRNPWEDVS